MLRVSLIAALLLFAAVPSNSQNFSVQEMVFCTSIEDREPVQPDSIFQDTVEQVYCFTRVTGTPDSTSIFHVWYHDGEEAARVELPVMSSPWRTWSSKRILKEWHGIWRVDILMPGGKLLVSKEFLVRPTE
jgi:hypothetical protein